MVGTASELQLFGTGDATHKAHATVALHATFFVEQDTGAEVHMLTATELTLGINKLMGRIAVIVLAVFGAHAGFALTGFHVVFLQGAFTGLVANGAIERVVHQHEFLGGLAGVLHAGTGCRRINLHTRSHRRIAGNHQHATAGAFLFHQALASRQSPACDRGGLLVPPGTGGSYRTPANTGGNIRGEFQSRQP